MFVVCVKSSKFKAFLLALALVVVGTIGGIISVSMQNIAPVASLGNISLEAETHEQRAAFFAGYGWEINEEPSTVKEVIIPNEFDAVYERYNTLQKAQKLDLTKYAGKRVKLWSYEITNYPGYEGESKVIYGNLLVYEGIIIGGDISCTDMEGFMTGFDGETGKDIMSYSE